MTREEIDIMWQQALHDSVRDGEMFTRYHFAKLVAKHTLLNIDPSKFISWQEGFEVGAAKEREACAKVCDAVFDKHHYRADAIDCAIAIRARGEA